MTSGASPSFQLFFGDELVLCICKSAGCGGTAAVRKTPVRFTEVDGQDFERAAGLEQPPEMCGYAGGYAKREDHLWDGNGHVARPAAPEPDSSSFLSSGASFDFLVRSGSYRLTLRCPSP